MKRKIAAIFAADIAGYSQAGCRGRGGDAAASRILSAGDRRLHRQIRRPDFQYRRRRRAGRISERGRSGALRDRHPGKPAHPQHGVSAEPADELSHRHHDRRCGRARRRSARRRRQHRGTSRGSRRGRRHLRFTRGARAGRQQAVGAVRRHRRAGSEEHPDAGACLYGGDAARGRDLRDPAGQEAAESGAALPPNWMWPLAVVVVCLVAHRRRRLPVFHQARAGGPRQRKRSAAASPAPALVAISVSSREPDASFTVRRRPRRPRRAKSLLPRPCRSSAIGRASSWPTNMSRPPTTRRSP